MAPYDQFILFGDSLTQMSCSQELGFAFQPALQNAFIRRLDIINRGFSGYNTAHALIALPQFMPEPSQAKVQFVAIFFGANDACLPGSQTGQHVPLADFTQNLKALITKTRELAPDARIILITPSPVNEYQIQVSDAVKYGPSSPPRRTAEHTKKYADACREVGAWGADAVLDLWSAIMKAAGWKEGQPLIGSKELPDNDFLNHCLSDGLHFLPPAYKILYEEMMHLIKRRWPDQYPIEAPYVLPGWEVASKA